MMPDAVRDHVAANGRIVAQVNPSKAEENLAIPQTHPEVVGQTGDFAVHQSHPLPPLRLAARHLAGLEPELDREIVRDRPVGPDIAAGAVERQRIAGSCAGKHRRAWQQSSDTNSRQKTDSEAMA